MRKMIPIRRSRQRDAIAAELAARTDHPTAEMLYQTLKPSWPGLSLGTVYRNLAQLCQAGTAQKLPGLGADHFDGNVAPHLHLHCECCSGVFDILLPMPQQALQALQQQAAAQFPGEIHGCQLEFTGICQACLIAKNNGEAKNLS